MALGEFRPPPRNPKSVSKTQRGILVHSYICGKIFMKIL